GDRLADLEALPNIRVMTRTTAIGLYDGNMVALVVRRGHRRPDPAKGEAREVAVSLRAKAILFATGALERPLVFANNDRPGIMLASAARTYLHRFAVAPGQRAVVVTGDFSLAAAIRAGASAGHEAAALAGHSAAALDLPLPDGGTEGYAIAPSWEIVGRRGALAFVDFQNDVTTKDVHLAHREGYESVEHLKRYTTLGMGTDQGKTSNINALAIMAGLRQIPITAAGTTTFRPPYSPVALGTLAGRSV